MKNSDLTILCLILLIAIIVLVSFSWKFIKRTVHNKRKRSTEIVVKNSNILKSLDALNAETTYHKDVKHEYEYNKMCETKNDYDTFDFDVYLLNMMKQDSEFFSSMIKKSNENSQIAQSYQSKYLQIKNSSVFPSLHIRKSEYTSIEQKLFKKGKLDIVCTFNVIIQKEFKNPNKNNYYTKAKTYNMKALCELLKKVESEN